MAAPNIAKDIRDYMVANGFTPVAINTSYTDPNDASIKTLYSVFEFPSNPNIKIHGGLVNGKTRIAIDRANVQIQARAETNQQALTNILAVITLLDGLNRVTINGTLYYDIRELTRPRVFEHDEDSTTTYVWEFQLNARRSD